ncbi:MAG: hypothetical protein ACE5MH_10690 [Terriglobia bacterium]
MPNGRGGQPVGNLASEISEGFFGALGEERALTREREAEQQALEQNILGTLIEFGTPEVQSRALASMLELAQPRPKAKGLRGFLDETERSAALPTLMQFLATPETVTERRPDVEAFPAAPPFAEAAVQPAASLVEQGAAGAAQAQPAAGIPQVPLAEAVGQPPPLPFTPQEVERPRQVFMTEADRDRALVEGQIQHFTDLLVRSGVPDQEAFRQAVGMALGGGAAAAGMDGGEFGGIVRGDQLPPGTLDVNGFPVDPTQNYRRQIGAAGSETFFPVAPEIRSAGVPFESTAQSLGFPNFTTAIQLYGPEFGEQIRLLESQRNAARAGDQTAAQQAAITEAGIRRAMVTPIDIGEAQRTGLPVGTAPEEVAGRVVPPPLGATQQAQIAESEAALGGIDRIRTLSQDRLDDWIGPIQGRTNPAALATGLSTDQDMAEFFASIATLRNVVIRAITGAQMGEAEARRIREQLPEPTQPPTVFRARLAETERNLGELIERMLNPPIRPLQQVGEAGVGTPPPVATAAPDLSDLAPGSRRRFTTGPFAGQVWQLGPDGQPQQVQ